LLEGDPQVTFLIASPRAHRSHRKRLSAAP
jgi:hypothetical protein